MKRITTKKIIYIACFVAFGLGVGFLTAWHDARYDTPLFLNLPGGYDWRVFCWACAGFCIILGGSGHTVGGVR